MPLLVVHLNGNAAAVVAHSYDTSFRVDPDTQFVHVLVALPVVCSVHQDLIEDLVEARHEADFAVLHSVGLGVVYPHLLLCSLHGANIGIGTLEDMLQLCELLVLISRAAFFGSSGFAVRRAI